jgi:hypothetical protein
VKLFFCSGDRKITSISSRSTRVTTLQNLSKVTQRPILRWVTAVGRRGLIFNRAPALLRRSVCAFRVPRPKPRLPEKVGTPVRKAARVVRGGACPPPLAHRGRRREGRISNRAPALPRRAFCFVRPPRPKSRRPEEAVPYSYSWLSPTPPVLRCCLCVYMYVCVRCKARLRIL